MVLHSVRTERQNVRPHCITNGDELFHDVSYGRTHSANSQPFGDWGAFLGAVLVHSCLFVLLSLLPLIVYICTVLFEQINDDDDDDEKGKGRLAKKCVYSRSSHLPARRTGLRKCLQTDGQTTHDAR